MSDVQPPSSPPTPTAAESQHQLQAKHNTFGLVSLILAIAGLVLAVLPPTAWIAWILLLPALILSIIALTRKGQPKGLAIAAVILAPVAWLTAVVVAIVGFVGIVNDSENAPIEPPSLSEPEVPEDVDEEPVLPGEPEAAYLTGGDYLVGEDIDPGQYRAEVEPSIIPYCAVSQSEDNDILDIRNATEGSVIFTVQDIPGSVVSFQGCENIALAAEVVRTSPSPITNGDWLVGPELTPGKYRGVVDESSVIPYGSITQSKDLDVIDITNGTEGSVIFTVEDLPGSIVSFQGLVDIQKVG